MDGTDQGVGGQFLLGIPTGQNGALDRRQRPRAIFPVPVRSGAKHQRSGAFCPPVRSDHFFCRSGLMLFSCWTDSIRCFFPVATGLTSPITYGNSRRMGPLTEPGPNTFASGPVRFLCPIDPVRSDLVCMYGVALFRPGGPNPLRCASLVLIDIV